MPATAGHSDGTVGRALEVLDAVAAHGRPVRFSELLATGRWPKATLHRLLRTLASQGLIVHDSERGGYSLGLRLVRLAHRAWTASSIGPAARPYLDALSARLDRTVHLAILDAGQVLYLDKRDARRPIPMFSDAGKVGPAYCTGVGKALLAFLPPPALDAALALQSFHAYTPATITGADALRGELAAVRGAGLAFDREEHERGIVCIAAPIRAETGEPLGALSVTSTTLRESADDLAALGPEIAACARRIAGALHPRAELPEPSEREAEPWA